MVVVRRVAWNLAIRRVHRFQERLSTDKEYLLQIARDVAKVAVGIEKGQVILLKLPVLFGGDF